MGVSQPILARDLTTWAPSGALATRTMWSAPAFLSRRSCGLMSGSPQLNFSMPTGLTPFSPSHLASPASLDCPHAVFSSRRPGFDFFSFFFNDPPTTEIYTLSLHDADLIDLGR